MIQVLVTGSEGQLGMSLQKIAANYPNIRFTFKDKGSLDITNKEKVKEVFEKGKFDFCINCSAFTNVEEAERNPDIAFLVNAEGAKNVAEACKEFKVKLIHISTDYVFNGEKEGGYLPSDVPNPINEYGRSKLKGEQYIQEVLDAYLIIRTSWLYSEFGHNFYKTILAKANRKETIYVTDAQKGCPTDTNHLAGFIMDILLAPEFKTGICHFTDGEAMTWFEFAKRIVKEHTLEKEVKVVRDKNYRSFAERPRNSVLLTRTNRENEKS